MNPWWMILSILGAAWIVPLLGARQAQLPWWFFVAVGCLWTVVLATAPALYDWGIRTRRKLGMAGLADWGERMRPRLLPPARLALLIMALLSFLFALWWDRFEDHAPGDPSVGLAGLKAEWGPRGDNGSDLRPATRRWCPGQDAASDSRETQCPGQDAASDSRETQCPGQDAASDSRRRNARGKTPPQFGGRRNARGKTPPQIGSTRDARGQLRRLESRSRSGGRA